MNVKLVKDKNVNIVWKVWIHIIVVIVTKVIICLMKKREWNV